MRDDGHAQRIEDAISGIQRTLLEYSAHREQQRAADERRFWAEMSTPQ